MTNSKAKYKTFTLEWKPLNDDGGRKMDMEILEKKQNPLLNRQEIRFKVLHPKEATPNRDSARDKIAQMHNVKNEQVIVDALDTTFGKSETTGYAKIYPSKDEAMKNERDYHLVRNRQKGDAKPKEKKAEAPATLQPPAKEKAEEDAASKDTADPSEGTPQEAPAEEAPAEEAPAEEAPAEEK
jgi:small subunit ribosomal protein S24e